MSLIAISTMASASVTASTLVYSSNIIKSLIFLTTDVSKSIYNLIKISNDNDLKSILVKSDIMSDINIIKLFIEEKANLKEYNKSVITCIDNISETLRNLEYNINCITSMTKLNNELWFSYFRRHDTTEQKQNIIFLIDQLKHRFNLLIKIISIVDK